MTTKELIRREIERRRAYQQEMYNKTKQDGRPNDGWAESLAIMGELEELRTFLDTLPDEPVTDCHDLDEAAHNYSESDEPLYSPGHRFHWDNDSLFGKQIETTFKAEAEWMKRKMMDEAYEEEVQEVYRDDDGIHCCVSVGTDYEPGTIVYVITIPKED